MFVNCIMPVTNKKTFKLIISLEEFNNKNQNFVFKARKKQILLMGVKGQIFAIDNRCPHEGYPLSKGFANDNCVLTCNWHNWKFNLKTGECLLGEDNVRNYPINIENGNIYVDINDPSIDQIKKTIYKGLKTAFKERQYGRISREITRLQFNNLNPIDAVKECIHWSFDHFEYGMTHAYAACADWLTFYNSFNSSKKSNQENQIICLTEAIDHISNDSLRHSKYLYSTNEIPYNKGQLLNAIENENEVEVPDCLIAIIPNQEYSKININKQFIADDFLKLTWHGIPNILSSDHLEWEGIQEASKSCEKPFTESHLNLERELEVLSDLLDDDTYPLQKAIHQRRSAVSMDRKTRIDRKTFYQFLIKTNPQLNPAPFQSFPWEPQVHLGLFVHRVNDLQTGLYLLVRNKKHLRELRENFKKEFLWGKPDFCPADLDLFLLEQGDYLGASKSVSCGQDIAGDGCFSLGMISAFEKPLTQYGSWFYPRLFWECGAIGQVLYLQAEVSGIRSTGIGCFFDDPVHGIFGIEDMSYQTLYHFTVGGPVEDTRLTTLPPY